MNYYFSVLSTTVSKKAQCVSASLGVLNLRKDVYLQVGTRHQENTSFDDLPAGLCPRGVICGRVLLQVEGRGQSFGESHGGANAEPLPLSAVRGHCALDPHVGIHLRRERGNKQVITSYLYIYQRRADLQFQ